MSTSVTVGVTANRRAGLAVAAVVAAVLAVFAVAWLVDPASASTIFGVPLSGTQLAYGRVKGVEDLLAAAVIALFLIRADARGAANAVLVGLLVPVGDLLAVITAGVRAPSELVIHFVFIAAMIASAALLRSKRHVQASRN